jgi:hypothetical protein
VQTEEEFERDLKMVMEATAAIAEGRHMPAAVQLSRQEGKRQRGGGVYLSSSPPGGGFASLASGADEPPGTPMRDADGAGRRITEEDSACLTPEQPGNYGRPSQEGGAETPLVPRTATLELSPFRASRVSADGS